MVDRARISFSFLSNSNECFTISSQKRLASALRFLSFCLLVVSIPDLNSLKVYSVSVSICSLRI